MIYAKQLIRLLNVERAAGGVDSSSTLTAAASMSRRGDAEQAAETSAIRRGTGSFGGPSAQAIAHNDSSASSFSTSRSSGVAWQARRQRGEVEVAALAGIELGDGVPAILRAEAEVCHELFGAADVRGTYGAGCLRDAAERREREPGVRACRSARACQRRKQLSNRGELFV